MLPKKKFIITLLLPQNRKLLMPYLQVCLLFVFFCVPSFFFAIFFAVFLFFFLFCHFCTFFCVFCEHISLDIQQIVVNHNLQETGLIGHIGPNSHSPFQQEQGSLSHPSLFAAQQNGVVTVDTTNNSQNVSARGSVTDNNESGTNGTSIVEENAAQAHAAEVKSEEHPPLENTVRSQSHSLANEEEQDNSNEIDQ